MLVSKWPESQIVSSRWRKQREAGVIGEGVEIRSSNDLPKGDSAGRAGPDWRELEDNNQMKAEMPNERSGTSERQRKAKRAGE